IAIVALAGRFPGAGSADELWELLSSGREGLRSFSEEELAAAGVEAASRRDPAFVAAGGVLDDVESFDADFFGINPREAEILDPQHRIFLECAWTALEEAGYVPGPEDRTGVFAGVGRSTYWSRHLEGHEELRRSVGDYQLAIANDKDFLATRVAYRLDLKGPAVNVQTACSTSLVAVHLACQSLRAGECDLALAGGVSLRLPQTAGYRHEEGMILSPDGHCRPFSALAAGTVGGNGAGVVLLKPLARALADGDQVRAVIRGSAVNNDGSLKAGFTAPNVEGQAAVIRQALAAAGVEPQEIDYVEAHGTGTELGDPIEVAALDRAFHGVERKIALGAVKSNIGHLDAAAGVTGLIKTVLCLEQEELPPVLHFDEPSPRIDFAGSPFEVVAESRPWQRGERVRRGGVSSFGIGGTNAHVVVEEAPARRVAAGRSEGAREAEIWVLSGRSEPALEEARQNLADFHRCHQDADSREVAYTLQTGRKAFRHRRALVVRRGECGAEALADAARGRLGIASETPPPLILLFPGQGAQHPSMGAGLYRAFGTYRRHLDRCAEILEPLLGFNLRTLLHSQPGDREAAARLRQTNLAQPALFAVASGLVELWSSLGVEGKAMIGHSIGEWVAAWHAGVLSLEDALALVAARGRLVHRLPPGSMVSVPLSEEELAPFLGADVALAAVNGPSQCVISGTAEAVEEALRKLSSAGLEGRRLHTSHAFHSPMMDGCLDAFREEVGRVELAAPRRPFVSNVTGTWIRADEATDPEYWVRQLRPPVRFADALATAAAGSKASLFLECGPGRSLQTFARSTLPGARALSSLPHPKSGTGEVETFLEAVGDLWLAGGEV
ncbi:MAG: type I polyketide synthase, partial [Acidobacteria bacterium]|nr:type I polyketide synthase [Acidobacteriota bacterium]